MNEIKRDLQRSYLLTSFIRRLVNSHKVLVQVLCVLRSKYRNLFFNENSIKDGKIISFRRFLRKRELMGSIETMGYHVASRPNIECRWKLKYLLYWFPYPKWN